MTLGRNRICTGVSAEHKQDFFAISGFPVTIRLLDPPLHEFLPEGDVEQIVTELTTDTGMSEEDVLSRIEKLSEVNPMLGFRGCRFDESSYFILKHAS